MNVIENENLFKKPTWLKTEFPILILDNFITECFNSDGEYNTEHIYRKEASKKNCKFCEFNQTEYCDVGVK